MAIAPPISGPADPALLERQLRRARAALREAEALVETRAHELELSNRELAAREAVLLERLDADNRQLLEAQRIGRFATVRETRDTPAIASPALVDVLGFAPGAGFHLISLAARVHPLDAVRFGDFLKAAVGDDAPAGDLDFEHRLQPDGAPLRWLRWRLRRTTDAHSRFEAITGTVQDITEPRAASRRLQALQLLDTRRARQMLRLAREVEVAQRARAAFLAMMSHDVRTPMTGLLGMLSLLGATDLTPEQRRQVGLAQRGAEQLRLLLDEIIKLAADETGRLALEAAPVAVAAAISGIVDFWRGARPDAADRVALTMGDGVPAWVSLDPTRFRQLVDNLVSDALERSAALVTVAVDYRPGMLIVAVGDSGRNGEHVDAPTGAARELGLAVCRRIVEAMGGTMVLTRAEGRGVVTLKLPITVVNAPERGTATRARILVVDDVDTNRMVVCGMLQLHGLDTAEAVDGLDAATRAAAEDFAAIIMDIAMPGLDGLEATRRIRALPGARGSVPIIGLTAHAGAREREAAIEAGMNICLSRPVDRATLTLVVDRHLGRVVAPSVPLLNQAAFRDIFDRFDGEARTRLFAHFVADVADHLSRLKAAVAAADTVTTGRALHSLGGIAGTFGLEALREALPGADKAGEVDARWLARIDAAAEGAVSEARALLGQG
ncbi:hypothetical protein IP88_10625 [alpha proteobacterium AAP81b]|nr:hypothetical protein IP88_10625 [alpha proteobacterium AAP81b]